MSGSSGEQNTKKNSVYDFIPIINAKLDELSQNKTGDAPDLLVEATRYSLLNGGKRLRGCLLMEACRMMNGNDTDSVTYACAIEMIHCFSLIHDDLPAMDDDDLRRGKPSNHVVYGEGMAILAGDALFSMAFERMLEHALSQRDVPRFVRAIEKIAAASGTVGIAGGQCLDLVGIDPNDPAHEMKLHKLHSMKTGSLIAAAVTSGMIIGGANDVDVRTGEVYGRELGLAFQIQDDILDAIGNVATLGKRVGMDASKVTYVSLFGLAEAKARCEEATRNAIRAIKTLGARSDALAELAQSLVDRQS